MSDVTTRRIYRLLLRLFPAGFRREFGLDMEQLFMDRLREVRSGPDRRRLWGAAVRDVVGHAAREWGWIVRTMTRDVIREGSSMDGWRHDLRFGLRSLMRRPGFTAAAVGTLALGIGATVSIFSVVNGVLLTPLPFPEPDRLVTVWNVNTRTGGRGRSVDHPDLRLWQQEIPGFQVSGVAGSRPTLTGLGPPEVLQTNRVTDGVITLMGLTPSMGRDLTAADDDPEAPRVVVVSHRFWSTYLDADPDVLGRTLQLSGNTWEIVGVGPEGFDYPDGSALWLPRRHQVEGCGHGCQIMTAVGRLDPGTSLEEVQERLDAISARLAVEEPDAHRDDAIQLEPMLDTEVAGVRTGLWVLFGAVGMVLLIACANVANLMLVRGSQRRSEIGLRLSIGATRPRIVRQLLTESLILATAAGVLGMALSTWGTATLLALAPEALPRQPQAGMDPTVVAFTVLLVFIVTTLFGLLPATQLSTADSARSRGRSEGRTPRSLLVSTEVALSLALLLGAGLLFRTLLEIRSVDYGFRTESAERFRMSLPGSRYDSLAVGRFVMELDERLAALPGVAAVGSGFGVPLSPGEINTSTRFPDREAVDPADRPSLEVRTATPGLLAAAGTPLLAGRWFTEADRYGSTPVAVINATAAARYFPGVDPVGRPLGIDVSWGFADTPDLEIVGVVADVRSAGATETPDPAVYLPNTQFGANSIYVWIRLEPGMPSVIPQARSIIAEMDAELAITDLTTVEDLVAAEQDSPRFYLTLLAVFSVLALVLSTVGLYGVVAYTVSQRTREIGIRIALGADSDRVVGMVVGQSARPVVLGLLVGLALALAGGRALESLLFGVTPTDPITIAAVSGLLLLVAAGATLLPARRASRIPTASALRTE